MSSLSVAASLIAGTSSTTQKDGNYGTQAPTVSASSSASTQSSSGVQAALTTLTLGGA